MDYDPRLNDIDQSLALQFGWCPVCSGVLMPRHRSGILFMLCVQYPIRCHYERLANDLERQKYYDYWD